MKSRAKEIRLKHGWSISEASTWSGVGTSTIQNIERGVVTVQAANLMRLALAYGCRVTDIYPALGAKPKKPMATRRVRAKARQILQVVPDAE